MELGECHGPRPWASQSGPTPGWHTHHGALLPDPRSTLPCLTWTKGDGASVGWRRLVNLGEEKTVRIPDLEDGWDEGLLADIAPGSLRLHRLHVSGGGQRAPLNEFNKAKQYNDLAEFQENDFQRLCSCRRWPLVVFGHRLIGCNVQQQQHPSYELAD
jgi:hypothetical protein